MLFFQTESPPLTMPSSFTGGSTSIHLTKTTISFATVGWPWLLSKAGFCLIEFFFLVSRFLRSEKIRLKTWIFLWVYGSFVGLCFICQVSKRHYPAHALSTLLPEFISYDCWVTSLFSKPSHLPLPCFYLRWGNRTQTSLEVLDSILKMGYFASYYPSS